MQKQILNKKKTKAKKTKKKFNKILNEINR